MERVVGGQSKIKNQKSKIDVVALKQQVRGIFALVF
jgi:hypothetical protein